MTPGVAESRLEGIRPATTHDTGKKSNINFENQSDFAAVVISQWSRARHLVHRAGELAAGRTILTPRPTSTPTTFTLTRRLLALRAAPPEVVVSDRQHETSRRD